MLLEYGKTYYWRVDEVNAAPSNTVFKGDVWSFTAEPYAYPVTGITATASSFEKATTAPANTVNGSGLTGDLHGTTTDDHVEHQHDRPDARSGFSTSSTTPTSSPSCGSGTTTREFEPVLGYGFKDVTIEYSLDGTTWTLLKDTQFAQATAVAGYAHNTTVDLGGVMAQYVKLTAKSNWSMVGLKQYGLSEVRFFYIPVQARAPQPAAAANGVGVDSTLDWRPGRDVTSQKVYFGTDKAAVANGTATAQTVTSHGFAPGALDFGTTYYWKVDEVGTATYPGSVWSFTTQEYAAVDDFESYADDEGSRIYETWVDGWTNSTGSVVGYLQAPFAETDHHSRRQAGHAVRVQQRQDALLLRDRADVRHAAGSGPPTAPTAWRCTSWAIPLGFADKGSNAFTVVSTGTDIWNNADQFRFVYKTLSGNGSITAKVDSLTRSDAWSKAGVMIRETLEAGSKHASIVVTPDNSCSQQYRNATGGASASADWTGTAVKAPYWVRVTRTGNTLQDGDLPGRQDLDGAGHRSEHHDGGQRLHRPVRDQPQPGRLQHGGVLERRDHRHGQLAERVHRRDAAQQRRRPAVPDGRRQGRQEEDGRQPGCRPPSRRAPGRSGRSPLSDLSGVNLAAVKKLTIGVGDKANPKAGAAGMLYIDDIQFGKPIVRRHDELSSTAALRRASSPRGAPGAAAALRSPPRS